MRDQVSRRPERPDDAPFRLSLFRDTRGGVLAGLDPALVETLLRQQLAGQAMSYAAAHPTARAEIVEQDGAPVGRIVTDRTAEAIHLVDIAVLSARRGRGIGTALLREVLAEARTAGLPVRLRVTADNSAARRLYERLGFAVTGAGAIDVAMCRKPDA